MQPIVSSSLFLALVSAQLFGAWPLQAQTTRPAAVYTPMTIQEAEKRIKENPNDVDALLSRAIYRTRTHETSTAIEAYNQVLRVDPRNVRALQDCSKLNLSNRRWAPAVADLTVLSKIAPVAQVYADLGDAKFQLHDYTGANYAWQLCHKLSPENTQFTERAGYGFFCLGSWLQGAACFNNAFRSTTNPTSWPLADAALAYIFYGMAGKKDLQEAIMKEVASRKPVDMDLFDVYTIDYLAGKIDAGTLILKRKGDPYYAAQANFFIGFDLASRGKTKEARPYLEKCNIASWAASDDFKLPLEAIAKSYLAKTK